MLMWSSQIRFHKHVALFHIVKFLCFILQNVTSGSLQDPSHSPECDWVWCIRTCTHTILPAPCTAGYRSPNTENNNITVMSHEHHGISNHWQPNCLFKSYEIIPLNNKENIKTPKLRIMDGPSWGESASDWWIPLTKVLEMQKVCPCYAEKICKQYWSLARNWFLNSQLVDINSSTPGQNGCHFADEGFKCIFVNEKFCTSVQNSLKFVPKGPVDNNPALV